MCRLDQAGTRRIGQKIKAGLKTDRSARAAKVGSDIKRHLESGELKEAWRCIKGWYSAATDKAPKPYHTSMKLQTKEREELYRKVAPPRGTRFQSSLSPSILMIWYQRMPQSGR